MRPSIAAVLIIVGGFVILAPLVSDHYAQSQHQANAMRVVENTRASDENKLFYLRDRYPMSAYSYICLVVGIAIVIVGIRGAGTRAQSG